jgi:hypothetical protein
MDERRRLSCGANCAGYENVTIEEIEFERWRPPGHGFRLMFSGQAWHWIAPEVRYVAARAGGSFRMTYATVLCLARAS